MGADQLLRVLVPAPATIPAATAQEQEYYDDYQEGRRVHGHVLVRCASMRDGVTAGPVVCSVRTAGAPMTTGRQFFTHDG